MSRLRILCCLLSAAVAALVLSACGEKSDPEGPPAQRAITVALDGPVSVNHIGLLTAERSGDFRKAGLGVTLRETEGPEAGLAELLAGRADLALTSEQAIIAARVRGDAAISVAAVIQEPLASIVTVDGHSAAPKDLRGKKVGTDGSDYANAVLDDVLQSAAVDPATVDQVTLGRDLITPLVRGRVDASLGPFWNTDVVRLRLRGQRPRFTSLDRAAVPSYDEVVLVARGATVQRDGALVRRFIQALMRGTITARRNRPLAVTTLRDADPTLSEAAATRELGLTVRLLFPPDPRRPFGWQDFQQWQDYADWMYRSAGVLTRTIDAGSVLTNEFLPGEGVGNAGSGLQPG